MRKMRYRLALLAVAACGCSAASTARAGADNASPNLAQLIELGGQTQSRLKHEAASWTAVHETPAGHIYVKITSTRDKRRVVFIDAGIDPNTKESFEIVQARVTMRDGFWYVLQGNEASQYRPFEALFNLPSLNDYLARSDPQFPDEASLKDARFDANEDGAAFFHVPPSVAMGGIAEATVENFRYLEETGTGLSKEQRAQLRALEQTLDRGVRIGIDLKTGMVVRQGIHGQRRWLRSFHWDDSVDEKAFALDGRTWTDETAEFDMSNPDEVAMLNYCPIWRPGVASDVGLTAVRLNLTTGQIRRIPYNNGSAAPGCFSLDRKRVFVMGSVGEYGALSLFELDPIDGSKRQLGNDSSAYGAMVFPKLSPDGDTLVAARTTVRRREAPQQSQIVLIDVDSGRATELGDSLDMNALSWLADGKGVIVGRWDDRSTRKISICRIDCGSGELTELRPGEAPVVLRRLKRILFEAGGGDRRMMTCDLDGSNATVVGDGLEKFGFPCPSPTGEKVLMMKYGGPDGPQPHIVDPITGTAKPIKVGKGLWAMPAWE
jgi:hypothetical protein